MSIVEVFEHEWAIRALIASLLVGVMCGLLGCFILLRNMALIGDALSHAILPGVVVGFMIAGHSILAFFTGAVIAGLIAAVLITWIQRNVKTKDDAAIGIVFTSMFAIGVMAISYISRKDGVHLDLKDFLFGNVLGISNEDLLLTGFITIYVGVCLLLFYRYFFITTFQEVMATSMGISVSTMHYFLMLLLSFAVVASLQSVGVILVVAMLIVPAATAYLLTNRLKWMLIISAIIGLVSTASGLLIAIVFETTPGPAMTIMGAFIYLLVVFLSPSKGLLIKWFRRNKKSKKIRFEDLLKQSLKLFDADNLTFESLKDRIGISKQNLNKDLNKMAKLGLLTKKNSELKLTDLGQEKALKLVRAHRLWETYMVQKMGMNIEHIHDQAEKFEHALPENILQQVDKNLGFPQIDPHGSPIPQQHNRRGPFLSTAKVGDKIIIAATQYNTKVSLKLWELGIVPKMELEVIQKNKEFITLKSSTAEYKVETNFAEKVCV